MAQEYRHKLKMHTTPKGRIIPRISASVPRTGGKGCIGWQSPKTPTGGANSKRSERGSGGADLQEAALMVPWRTPRVTTNSGIPSPCVTGKGSRLEDQAAELLASPWVTPSSRDHKDSPGMATEGTNPDGTTRNRDDQLPRQAALTSGADTQSSHAETEKRGSLNPALPRWLMAFPVEWCQAAIRAHRAMPTRRQKPA